MRIEDWLGWGVVIGLLNAHLRIAGIARQFTKTPICMGDSIPGINGEGNLKVTIRF